MPDPSHCMINVLDRSIGGSQGQEVGTKPDPHKFVAGKGFLSLQLQLECTKLNMEVSPNLPHRTTGPPVFLCTLLRIFYDFCVPVWGACCAPPAQSWNLRWISTPWHKDKDMFFGLFPLNESNESVSLAGPVWLVRTKAPPRCRVRIRPPTRGKPGPAPFLLRVQTGRASGVTRPCETCSVSGWFRTFQQRLKNPIHYPIGTPGDGS